MRILIIGLILFIGIHFVPAMPSLKASLSSKLGANGYKGLFSIVSFVGLGLIIYGMSIAEFKSVYSPPDWGRVVTLLLMVPALILMPAANMPTNIKRFVRHPMMTGVLLWGVGHLFSNGDLASLVLFGSMAGYSVFSMASANSRGASTSTTVVPVKKDIMVILIGLVVFVLIAWFHGSLFGAPLF